MKRRGTRRSSQPGVRSEHTGRAIPGTIPEEDRLNRSPESALREAEQQRTVIMLTVRGFTPSMIAQQLGVDPKTVSRIRARAFEDYRAETSTFITSELQKAFAKYDMLDRVWMVRAMGGAIINPDGSETRVEPDKEAYHAVLRSQRDRNVLINHGRPQRVEHTGAEGGPIVTAQASPAETARMINAAFQARARGDSPAAPKAGDGSNGTTH